MSPPAEAAARRDQRLRLVVYGYVTGVVALTAGVWWLWGVGWALIVAGAITAASFLLLVDTDPGPSPRDHDEGVPGTW